MPSICRGIISHRWCRHDRRSVPHGAAPRPPRSRLSARDFISRPGTRENHACWGPRSAHASEPLIVYRGKNTVFYFPLPLQSCSVLFLRWSSGSSVTCGAEALTVTPHPQSSGSRPQNRFVFNPAIKWIPGIALPISAASFVKNRSVPISAAQARCIASAGDTPWSARIRA